MFGFLQGASQKNSDKLRDQLFLLAQKSLNTELEELCRQRSSEIVEFFGSWQQAPSKIRSKPKELQQYAQGLMAVAQTMAELGEDHPMDLLSQAHGDGKPSWRSALRQAIELMQKLQYADAVRLLEPYLVAGQEGRPEGTDQYLGITLGKLGECEYQLAHFDKAEAHLRKALAVCQQQQDWDGVFCYLGNLYELQRYQGEPDAAKAYALQLGKALKSQGRSDAEALRMALTAHGPAVRVVATVAGATYELDQLPLEQQHVEFGFARNRSTLAMAASLNARGRKEAETQNFQAALDSFSKAAQIDAYDPESRYLAGLSLLHLKRYSEAAATYRQLERLAPGWFQARHDLWVAQELAARRLSHEAWQHELQLLDAPLEPVAQVERASAAVARFPEYAPLHFAQAQAQARLGQDQQANQSYQKALKLAGNDDLKSRILVAASQVIPELELRKHVLAEAASLKQGNLVASATAGYLLRHLS